MSDKCIDAWARACSICLMWVWNESRTLNYSPGHISGMCCCCGSLIKSKCVSHCFIHFSLMPLSSHEYAAISIRVCGFSIGSPNVTFTIIRTFEISALVQTTLTHFDCCCFFSSARSLIVVPILFLMSNGARIISQLSLYVHKYDVWSI